jgi:hypothetical protein
MNFKESIYDILGAGKLKLVEYAGQLETLKKMLL